jgi:predicted Zn-dependent peptidase
VHKQTISRTRLGKGLTILSDRMPGVRSVSLGLWIKRGSRDEKPRALGISHFYEHMIFKGTAARTPKDIASVLEKSGGSLNAFTGKEQICLHARFVDNQLPEACELFQDIFRNSVFSEVELAKEKNVVLEEIASAEDNPEEFVHDLLMENLWFSHPLGTPITGRKENVRGFTQRDLFEFSRTASGSELVVSAAGNIRHEKLCELFKGLASRCRPEKTKRPKNHGALCRRKLFEKEIQQANVALGFRVCPYTSDDRYALFVLNALLGDGMSSRLFQRIREDLGLVYSIYSFHEAYEDTGVMGVFFGTEPTQLQKAMDQVLEELRKLLRGEIDASELEFAKSYIKGNVLLGMESTGTRMGQLARSEIYLGRVENLEKTLKEIDRVNVGDIRRLGKRYFKDSNLAIAAAVKKAATFKDIVEKVKFA